MLLNHRCIRLSGSTDACGCRWTDKWHTFYSIRRAVVDPGTTHYRTTNTTRTHEHNGWTQAWRTAAMLEVEVTMHADRPPPPSYRPHHVNGAPILPLIGAIDARCRRLLLLGSLDRGVVATSPRTGLRRRRHPQPDHTPTPLRQ